MPIEHVSATTRTVATNGVELAVTDAGDGFPIVLAHGFPELSYSWRHQVPALAAAGYRVLAPDQRGYGRSSRPEAIEDYDIVHLTDDLLGLVDDIGAERAVFVGHDWGSMVVWNMALLHPDRVAGVAGLSVPFVPRGPMPPVQLMRKAFGDAFFYIVYFQEPGVADADLGRDPGTTMRRMLAGLSVPEGGSVDMTGLAAPDGAGFVDRLPEAEGLPSWLTQDDLDHYTDEFTRTGFTGGINWYRNFDRNWKLTAHLDGAKVTVPSAFITGSADPVALMMPAAVMDGWVEDHRGTTTVDGAGHWVQQERPDEVNAALLTFIDSLDLGGH
ncbi:MAG: alpha/beta hydrolase [Acidimicrobiales bacterium]|nr:alpha/beta hydrolase [Acidimicrobiales bacterium]